MFRALLTHPQGVLQKRYLVYYVRISVGSDTFAVNRATQSTDLLN
jgi:hypothetical protein